MQIADGMSSNSLLLAPADSIVGTTCQLIKGGPFWAGAELEITDLVERKDSLTF